MTVGLPISNDLGQNEGRATETLTGRPTCSETLHDSTSHEARALCIAAASLRPAARAAALPIARHTLRLLLDALHHSSSHEARALCNTATSLCAAAWAATLPVARHALRLLLDALHDST